VWTRPGHHELAVVVRLARGRSRRLQPVCIATGPSATAAATTTIRPAAPEHVHSTVSWERRGHTR
jgi:hypothetical protein